MDAAGCPVMLYGKQDWLCFDPWGGHGSVASYGSTAMVGEIT